MGAGGTKWGSAGMRVSIFLILFFSVSVFIGEYKHALDEKGRIALPSKFRSKLSAGAVVTRGLDTSLFLFPKEEWEKLAHKLVGLPLGSADSRAFARLMLAGAMDVVPDKQGRVMLPEYLRRYAHMEKNIVVAGLYTRLELWDERAWEEYKKRSENDVGGIAEKLGELGI